MRRAHRETISNALAEGSEFAGIVRTLDADRVVYSFAVRGEQIELLGIVSMIARLSGKQTEARPLNYVRPLIQPALECLRREMLLRLQLGSREQDLGGRERDLSLMLEMSSPQSASQNDADEFELIPQDESGSHALRAGGAVGAGKGHRPDSHAKRPAHGRRRARNARSST